VRDYNRVRNQAPSGVQRKRTSRTSIRSIWWTCPVRGSGGKPLKLKNLTFNFSMPNRSSKFASFSIFYKLASQAPNVTYYSFPMRPSHEKKNNFRKKWGLKRLIVHVSYDSHESARSHLARRRWRVTEQSECLQSAAELIPVSGVSLGFWGSCADLSWWVSHDLKLPHSAKSGFILHKR